MARPITELDRWTFNEGSHIRLFEVMGAHIDGDGVQFRVWAPNAATVSVIGDFNDWDATRGAMIKQGNDFTLDLPLPAGRYGWSFQVDGRTVAPGGVTLADDGFGGKSAVLSIESDQ